MNARCLYLLPPVAALVLVLATGCGSSVIAPSPSGGEALSGRIVGGQQPIANASVMLYAAGSSSTGNGTGALNLLRTPVATLADGSFTLSGDYTCPSMSTQVYIVARGGNPGLPGTVNNTASVLMAALGDCGNLSASTYTNVNEVTTAAGAWALSRFLGPNANIGSSTSNITGLRNAFLIASNLANNATGLAGGPTLPAGATLEPAKLYSLANALAGCVNSAGGISCTPLFAASTNGGVVPANTLDAALSIVRNPSSNIAAVFGAAVASPPFPGGLAVAPHDWTMSLTYTGGGIALPTAVAIDSTGSIWAANYFGGVASKLSATGVPASAQGYADSALRESYAIAIDSQDSVWITNQESGNTNNGFGTVSKFSSSGQLLSGSGFGNSIYYPEGIAADANGNMWVADNGHSQASLLANDGTSLAGPNGYSSGNMIPLPVAVAIDAQHNAWFTGQGAATKVTPGGAIAEYACCRGTSAIAIDQLGSVWVADYSASALVQLDASGTLLQTIASRGGLYYPETLAIDGAGAVWLSNYHGNTVSAFGGASGGAANATLSPSYGFGLDAALNEPFGLAIDASGNVWVGNFGSNSLTEFVGVAAPKKTPFLGPPAQP